MSDEGVCEALRHYVQRQTGASQVSVRAFSTLSGGAIQNNYALALECAGGESPGLLDLVVRSDAASQVDASLSREQEFCVLQCAWQAGVTVPEPLWLCTDLSVIGVPFCVMRRVEGTASGRQLVRGMLSDEQARVLTRQLAHELARLHTVRPPNERLTFLPVPVTAPALQRVSDYRTALDRIAEPHPVIEWALNWLEDNAPAPGELVLCHGDFRTGNYMVDNGRLSGVLDWEFASWSDPMEDIGWLCAKSWRFGRTDREVGGVGHKDDLFPAYTHASGREVSARQVLYWEAMGLTRWAVIALQQAQRHISGEESSLELALTGRMVPEMEYDLLRHIGAIEDSDNVQS
ncbi:phosphotransferase family protein [Allopusillimonas ginsengisoli]|nr:phosphotransferase family protein [Allopusillimonas ginsengisoli]